MADTTPDAAPGQTFSASYYLQENRQGTVAGIGAQEGKNQTVAPEEATYIYIEGEADGVKVAYRIYPGENNTTDFNIVRNRVYNIDARILGMNTVDWRVSTAEVVVTPLAERYAPGASAAATLELVSTNDADNEFYLTYLLDAGQGTVAIDGERRTAGTPYPLLCGNGTAIAEIVYTQDTPGDVRLRLVVTDRYGFSIERELTTVYKNPELKLFTIIELVGTTCYSCILYQQPVPMTEYRPCLHQTISAIMSSFIQDPNACPALTEKSSPPPVPEVLPARQA